jgi:hypothetical protein
MNDEPKSIWKKPLMPRGWFFAWLVLMAATVFVFVIIEFIIEPHMNLNDLGKLSISGVVVGTTLLCLWMLVRWLCNLKNLRRFLFGCACFITLMALLYVVENWRSQNALNEFKRELAAKGEKIDFKDIVPPRVPDEQNFALAPVVYSSYGQILTHEGKEIPPDKRDTNFVNRLQMPVVRGNDDWPTNGAGNWQSATLTDLKPWQDYYRALAAKTNLFPVPPQPQTPAQDVLLALSKYDSTIEELRAASQRPYSRFPVEYDKDEPATILLPHLAMMKGCSQILRLHAIAELQNNETEKSLADVKLMLYLVNSMCSEPILISHLVRIAMATLALQPIYEGLAAHKWSDAQLAEMDSELRKLDFLADYEFAMRGERAFGMAELEYMRRSRNFQALDYSENGSHTDPASHLAFRLAPSSFFYWNELSIAQMQQQWALPMVDLDKRLVSPSLVEKYDSAATNELTRGWIYKNVFARMVFPALAKAVEKFVHAQSSLDLARVAIALERFRLAHGKFPESLDALAPQFTEKIPHDIINCEPLHYHRTDDGQFVLYSVGWNERDDGGKVVFRKNSESAEISQGDWVWRYPAQN